MCRSLMYLTVSRPDTQVSLISVYEIKQILRNPALLLLRELSDFSALEKCFRYLSVAKKASLVDKVAMFSAKTEDIATAGCLWLAAATVGIHVRNFEDLLGQGFAAALAVSQTGASQSRQSTE
ncbi:hypothetical protein Tco_1090079 [Tanacetum coccineum]|uniref:Uncharacterized protein n=1 Tax=Tanacetum coccineum TaxID=301880 RepID=A0ABQ5I354_9ASTR